MYEFTANEFAGGIVFIMNDTRFEILSDEIDKFSVECKEDLSHKMTKILCDDISKDEQEQLSDEVRSELDMLKKLREKLMRLLLSMNAAIDEFDTLLNEEQNAKRKKKNIIPTNAQIDINEKTINHFAQGITFYKLFWVFFIGCFMGVVIEVIWCIVKNGHYESRVGLIYGPFNLVYGIGALFLTLCLYNYRNRNKLNAFIGGFLVGSLIEYFCSFFQEMLFGSTSWDYSDFPFNINGRICLLYSIFWGILGVAWIKQIYPLMAKWILKIPNNVGKAITWVLVVFMIFNTIATGLTVFRWSERINNEPPSNIMEEYIDVHYPNERMERIFANLEFVKE